MQLAARLHLIFRLENNEICIGFEVSESCCHSLKADTASANHRRVPDLKRKLVVLHESLVDLWQILAGSSLKCLRPTRLCWAKTDCGFQATWRNARKCAGKCSNAPRLQPGRHAKRPSLRSRQKPICPILQSQVPVDLLDTEMA
jgi:hypothetical protein